MPIFLKDIKLNQKKTEIKSNTSKRKPQPKQTIGVQETDGTVLEMK